MRRFYRCKVTLDFGWTRYLGRDATQWIGVEDKAMAYAFPTRRDALRALADVGGQWAKRGRIVLVTVRTKAAASEATTDRASKPADQVGG